MTSPHLPRIRSCQIGLRNPAAVDQIKADMRSGHYAFSEPRGRIGGWRDSSGGFYVNDGNHRMVAALEIYRETKDPAFVLELIRWGVWTLTETRPSSARPMPSRHWWGAFRNWLGV